MAKMILGGLEIGEIPKIVGTVSNKETLLNLSKAESLPCDIIEVRLDIIGESVDTYLDVLQSIEMRGLPIIFTVRPEFEGGKWSLKEEERLSIFKKVSKYVSTVDIEYRSSLTSEICEEINKLGKPTVISFHDFDKTPEIGELKRIVSGMGSNGNIIAKISTMVNSDKDIDILKKLLENDWEMPLCVIGMGAKGTRTRFLFPTIGSCLTYGYLDVPSAPGQFPCTLLMEQLRLTMSQYNEDVIIRHEVLECV